VKYHGAQGVECPEDAGNRGIKVNKDHPNANDAFKITTTSKEVCAERTNGNLWGQKLQILCVFKNIPAFQAKWMTTAPGHLCENRGSLGGKGPMSTNAGKGKFKECMAWVRKNKACGTHFNFGMDDGWCDCVPKGTGFCKLWTDANTVKARYSAYEIYTTTTTTTPVPTPNPTPAPVTGLKSAKGWKVLSGKCTIDISDGPPCAVSPEYPSKYTDEESCVVKMTNTHALLPLKFQTEKYFDIMKIGSIQLHGRVKIPKINLAKGVDTITWSSDFYLTSGGWKICKTKKGSPQINPKKKKRGRGKRKKA